MSTFDYIPSIFPENPIRRRLFQIPTKIKNRIAPLEILKVSYFLAHLSWFLQCEDVVVTWDEDMEDSHELNFLKFLSHKHITVKWALSAQIYEYKKRKYK